MLFYDPVNAFFEQNEVVDRSVMTLGPSGTSSYAAAVRLAQLFPSDVRLFPTYETAADALHATSHRSAMIVANAYAQINRFYISNEVTPIGAFFNNTPAYVLAGREESALNGDNLVIASHPAPKHLIAELAHRRNVTFRDTDSTHQAAVMAANGDVDVCLTTQTAAEICGLQTIRVIISTIPMLWTIFTCQKL